MNKKLFLVAIATLGLLVACGQKGEEPSSSKKPSNPSSSQKASSDESKAPATDWTVVVPHTWTDGTPAQNSDGKEYIPLTDAAAGKVGVKISIQNYTVEGIANDAGDPVTETTSLGSDGKIAPGNDHKALLTFKVKAPKAGDYQLVMRGKASSSHLTETLDDRAFYVRLNGVGVNVEGNRAPFAGGSETIDFVAAPTITLTGNEDAIMIGCSDYRVIFDVASYLIFAEH